MPNTNDDIILYYDSKYSTKNITVKKYNDLISNNNNKEELADFVYNRLYSRYIKPFEFSDETYKNEYKNGFSMMASFCLLIETLQSFKEGLGDSKNISGSLIKIFFYETKFFPEFKNQGKEIYENIRCGILHQGETTRGWKITRVPSVSSSFSKKTINANEFMNNLKKSLTEYKKELISEDWDSTIWQKFRTKMEKIIENTKG